MVFRYWLMGTETQSVNQRGANWLRTFKVKEQKSSYLEVDRRSTAKLDCADVCEH